MGEITFNQYEKSKDVTHAGHAAAEVTCQLYIVWLLAGIKV